MTLSVVPASLLRDQDAFLLTDALKNASGVNVGTGFGVFDYFVVRGIDSLTGGLVLTDGAPEPESTFYPLYNVRQVEVLKGPAGFLYGGNPLAGAVQMVRKQPVGARFAEGSLTYGRFGTFAATVDGNAATEDGRLSFRLNGAWQGTDHYRDLPERLDPGREPHRPLQARRSHAAALRLRVREERPAARHGPALRGRRRARRWPRSRGPRPTSRPSTARPRTSTACASTRSGSSRTG